MLTLGKMQNIRGQSLLRAIQACKTVRIVLNTGCSGPVIGSSTAYKLIIFRPPSTDTMLSTAQILRTATKWRATWQTKIGKFPSLIRILHKITLGTYDFKSALIGL